MTRLLHISASPRGDASESLAIAAHLLGAVRDVRTEVRIDTFGPGRPPALGDDVQAPYVHSWLRWTGIENITSIEFRPNLATADADTGRQQAFAEARDVGEAF